MQIISVVAALVCTHRQVFEGLGNSTAKVCAGDSPVHINGMLKTVFHKQSEKLKYFTTGQGLQEVTRWHLMPFFGIPVPVSRCRGNRAASAPPNGVWGKLLH